MNDRADRLWNGDASSAPSGVKTSIEQCFCKRLTQFRLYHGQIDRWVKFVINLTRGNCATGIASGPAAPPIIRIAVRSGSTAERHAGSCGDFANCRHQTASAPPRLMSGRAWSRVLAGSGRRNRRLAARAADAHPRAIPVADSRLPLLIPDFLPILRTCPTPICRHAERCALTDRSSVGRYRPRLAAA